MSTITSEELQSALQENCTPDFRNWAWESYNRGFLNLYIKAIISAQNTTKATTNVEAVVYLKNHVESMQLNGYDKITLGDLRRTSRPLYKRLEELLSGGKQIRSYDRTRCYGVFSHYVIPELFFGNIINLETSTRKERKRLERMQQLSFFGAKPRNFGTKNATAAKPHKTVSLNVLIGSIERDWKILIEEIKVTAFNLESKNFKKLCENLRCIFGEHLFKVLNHGFMQFVQDDYLFFLTMMTWAGALVHYKMVGNMSFFREISILPYSSQLGAGRIDAISVLRIQGNEPTAIELKKIRTMTRKDVLSVGHIIRDLLKVLGPGLELLITDWKFSVGDGPNSNKHSTNIIKSDDITNAPLPEHEKQVKAYMALAFISYVSAVWNYQETDIEKVWDTQPFTMRGRLVYLTPDRLPVVHDILMTHEEVRAVFMDYIVSNFGKAQAWSRFRTTSNHLVKHAEQLVNGSAQPLAITNPPLQLAFEGETDIVSPKKAIISQLIEKYNIRTFRDEYRIIEIVGKDGKNNQIYRMHLNRLFEAIEKGEVEKPHVWNSKKIVMCCVVHNEKTPSMHVTLQGHKPIFKCFGCGVGGKFALESVPDDMKSIVASVNNKFQHNATLKLVIDEPHQTVMKAAQQILRDAFWGSPAESYLYKVRCLDPAISYGYGAGFADINLVTNMLDSGFTYRDLWYYGFIGFSENVKKDSTLVGLLLKRGLTLDEIYQKEEVRGGAIEYNLPYLVLNKMVTYPLDIEGINNSFYGRSVDPLCPKSFSHRKLNNDFTNMVQGGFNLTRAMQNATDILVTEAPIDVMTFVEMGSMKGVGGIVGTNNDVLLEQLAGFYGNIIWGNDWDESKEKEDGTQIGLSGQRATLKSSTFLRQANFKGNLYDFTKGFVEKNPNERYKDINAYWIKHRKSLCIGDFIVPINV